jgi:N6-adenosine-specific RNA methylase IME4
LRAALTSGPHNEVALDIIKSWGFEFKTWAFVWVKTNPNAGAPELEEIQPQDLKLGNGYGTRANSEVVLLGVPASRGAPLRLNADVRQVVIAPVTEHSEKPEEVRRRIERLYPGPYLELFARRLRPGWVCWGDELPPPAPAREPAAEAEVPAP